MKPYKITLFLIAFLLSIALLAFFMPKKGIQLTDDIHLDFPTLKEIYQKPEDQYKDISEILNPVMDKGDSLVLKPDEKKQDSLQTDTIKKDSIGRVERDKEKQDTIRYQKPETQKADLNRNLQYPGGDKSILYPLFTALNEETKNKLIRVLHYGDSQIEGDRITSYLRNEMQKKFGGTGFGMFPAKLPFNTTISMKYEASKSWIRYTTKNIGNSSLPHKKFGVLLSFSKFSPIYSSYQGQVYEASIELEKSPIGYERNAEFNKCRIFYSNNDKPFIVKLSEEGEINDADMIPPTNQLKDITWTVDPASDEYTLHFQGVHSPDIYGISMESNTGVMIDNIPLRGNSGTDFTKTNMKFYKTMVNSLNVKMIILHFGVNVVPMIRENYNFYKNSLYKQLIALKNTNPELAIIVMGVSDMSRKEGSRYESYPNIEKIRNAQKNAAFKAGCVFWDTYEAMGGKNSMPSWVFADPPLARKDFTHFTYRGSKVIAKMFHKALMKDYEEFMLIQQETTTAAKPDSL